jgi:hypothetical protein
VRISGGAGLKLMAWPTCSQDCHARSASGVSAGYRCARALVLKEDKTTMEVVEMAQKMLAR